MSLLGLLSRLVPPSERREWLREWRAELEHARMLRHARSGPAAGRSWLRVLLAAAEDGVRLGARRLAPGSLGQDVRFALRVLRKSPVFTGVATLTLALGIGANTAIFTVVDAVLVRPLDYPEAERIVQLVNVEDREESATVSLPNFRDYRQRLSTVEDLGYSSGWAPVYGAEEPRRLEALAVTSGYFRLFGGEPALGRYPRPDEDPPGSAAHVVLSHAFWTEELGRDPDVVGADVLLDGVPHRVIGVARRGLIDPFLGARDLWRTPPGYLEQARRSQAWLVGYGRLAEGGTLAGARAEMQAVDAALSEAHPEANAERSVRLVPLRERLAGDLRPAVLLLLGSVLLVLLVACANVANLMLTRGADRDREIAVRMCLGAGRGRLARQLITESLVLALLGGVLGAWLGGFGIRGVRALGAPGLPAWVELGLDLRVFGCALVATLLTGVLFGLAPVRHLAGAEPGSILVEGGRVASTGPSGRRLRTGLVVAEIALATILLVAAGLMARSFANLSDAELGVEPEGVLTVTVTPGRGAPAGSRERAEHFRLLRERVASLPGTEAVGQANALPLTGDSSLYPFTRDDRPAPAPGREPLALARVVTPGYFPALGVELGRGRLPAEADGWDAPRVVIVNESLVRRFFAGEDPVGKRLTVHGSSHEIVGVVDDVRAEGPATAPRPTLYTLHGQSGAPTWMRASASFAVRTVGDPMALAADVREAIWGVDRAAAVDDVGPFARLLERHRAAPRMQASLLAGFASLATLLAAVGVAGVMSYSVASRSREIGIRRALGARHGDVVGMVLSDVGRMAAAGLLVGMVGAAILSRLMSGLLFGVAPIDPATFAGVGAGLFAVALLSGYVPARRAGRVDPVTPLRGG